MKDIFSGALAVLTAISSIVCFGFLFGETTWRIQEWIDDILEGHK